MYYKAIKRAGTLIRLFCLPNPFAGLPGAFLINVLMEVPLHTATFLAVGLVYDAGSFPAIGSLLYLIFYALHTFALPLLVRIGVSLWLIAIIAVIYIVVLWVRGNDASSGWRY